MPHSTAGLLVTPLGRLRRTGTTARQWPPRKLQKLSLEQWRAVVLQPASTFGFESDFWTAKRLHQVIGQLFAMSVAPRTIVRRLQEAGLTCQKPTREHFEADPVARQE